MAYNYFDIQCLGKKARVPLVDLTTTYIFHDTSSEDSTMNALSIDNPPGASGDANIVTAIHSLLDENVDAYFQSNEGESYYTAPDVKVLAVDGSVDPLRKIEVVVEKTTVMEEPYGFEKWANTPMYVDDDTIQIPGNQIVTPTWGSVIYRWDIVLKVRPSADDIWYDALIINDSFGADLKYIWDGDVESNTGYIYYKFQKVVLCRINHYSDTGSVGGYYPTLGACGWPINEFAPSFSTIYGYWYRVGNEYPPSDETSNKAAYVFLYGGNVYGSGDPWYNVPELGLSTGGDTPGGGGGPWNPSNPGTGTTPGGDNVDTNGWGDSDPNNTTTPADSGTGVNKGQDGQFHDTFGGGLTDIGTYTGNGGYSLVGMNIVQLGHLLSTVTSNDMGEGIAERLINLFGTILGCILSCKMYPFSIPGTAATLSVAGSAVALSCSKLNSQYLTFDFGMIACPRPWGNYLDYTQTSVSIYLPFIGWQPLNCSEVMGRNLHLVYVIDLSNGTFTATLSVSYQGQDGGRSVDAPMYQWSGICGTDVPLETGASDQGLTAGAGLATAAAIIGTAGVAAAAGGITAAQGAAYASKLSGAKAALSKQMALDDEINYDPLLAQYTGSGTVSANPHDNAATRASQAAVDTMESQGPPQPVHVETLPPSASAVIGGIIGHSMASSGGRGSGGGGCLGYTGSLIPALLLQIPQPAEPAQYAHMYGRPSMTTVALQDASGYIEVSQWEAAIPGASASEVAELDNLLRGGVWV